jgi:hypothetical protein
VDYTKIYRADMATLLGPDENVFAVVPYRLAFGAEPPPATPEEAERRLGSLPRGLRRRVADLGTHERPPGNRTLLHRVLDFDWPWDRVDVDEKIGGTAVGGAPGSIGVRFADATRDRVGQFAVVTAQRLAVAHQQAKDRFALVAEAPRADVVSAVRRGRLLQRGRVVIAFADGSAIAVNTGILLTKQAKRLVAALYP